MLNAATEPSRLRASSPTSAVPVQPPCRFGMPRPPSLHRCRVEDGRRAGVARGDVIETLTSVAVIATCIGLAVVVSLRRR
jgi:hypothetical protein